MNILLPDEETLGENDIIHTWYSPITNKNTMHFSDNLPLDIPKEFEDKEIYIILDKFEAINYEFLQRIQNKKVCLDVGAEEFIEYYTNQYLISFFKQANIIQINNNIRNYLFNKLKICNEIDFFNLLDLDLLVITKGKKGASFIFKENNEFKNIEQSPEIIASVTDSSGAGDAFFATVIKEYAYSTNINSDFIYHTFSIANKASRDVISQMGSRRT